MNNHFDLTITADYATLTAEFMLNNNAGTQLAYKKTDFKNISLSHQLGLFDLRNYVRCYVEEGQEIAAVADIGVCIAEEVLGKEIFEKLWESRSQRTLRIQLPGAGDMENHLAAALARVPWEIARPNAQGETLNQRNLLVRVVHDMRPSPSDPIQLKPDEPLRVLFVFAESRGSRPLGARKERRELLRLFEQEIYPKRRVVAHFLTHGVTRERLTSQIQEQGGYHVVHWSGHGNMNLLELCQPGGAADHLSGQELLALFNQAGGFLPRLFFLSACHSGDILRVKDWADFLAMAQGKEPGERKTEAKDLDLKEQPGYTGTAHALLQGGVPSVVAMRYAVGDDYAREAAVEFYRALLAHPQPKNIAAALSMARQAMLDPLKHNPLRFSACDHATPVLYGEEQHGLTLLNGRSPSLNPRSPRQHSIAELTTAEHEHFVGRTWELVGLGAEFIGSSSGEEVKPVAVISGLGGMGKTALTAEALALWESRFDQVLLYQAKPNRLEFETTLRDIHMKLMGDLKLYHNHIRQHPADAIYRDADPSTGFTGPARRERLTENLLRALRDEPILIVLDNFETNLKDADPVSQLSACQDPAWDHCLARLARELKGSPSRVLITCRRPLAALPENVAHSVLLGPLRSSEAALYLREQPTLGGMVFGEHESDQALAMRLLNASRFHPLLMDRLAKLAALPAPRTQLLAALEALENSTDFTQLPGLFTVTPGDAKELAYLTDALVSSLDQLLRDSTPDARRLLWIIALANQPEALGLVKHVWSGESHEQEQLREIQRMLAMLPLLPPELQAELKALPPEFLAMLDDLPPAAPARPDMLPLLTQLVSVGLVTEERDAPDDLNPNLTCHELIRERIRAWMEQHPHDQAELTESGIWLAYAERLEAVFQSLQHENATLALAAGSCALVYCVQAGGWERLGSFAGALVTSTSDPRLLTGLVQHLLVAAETAPEGEARWRCLAYLADALRTSGRADTSLKFYEQAAHLARTVAEAGGEGSRSALLDLAWITSNWAFALMDLGHLDAARERRLEAAEAHKQAGSAAVDVIGSELEALRIDIEQGEAATALPKIRSRLAQVWRWWRKHRAGLPLPEAPNAEKLARTLIGALDIALHAHSAQEDWPAGLRFINAMLKVQQQLKRPAEEIATTRMNRAVVLGRMRHYHAARQELEACLPLFQNQPDRHSQVLSPLAQIFNEQGDYAQAIALERQALALREQLPDPAGRAISHNNLANYLQRGGESVSLTESRRHRLGSLLYFIVAGLGQHLQTSFHNYAENFRRAHAAGTELTVPRVTELLANPAFAPLKQWLRQRKVDLGELQAFVDQFLDLARQAAQTT